MVLRVLDGECGMKSAPSDGSSNEWIADGLRIKHIVVDILVRTC